MKQVIPRAGNGCANFMGAWHFWFFLLGYPHAHKIPPFFWGGGFWAFLEGIRVEVPILFFWAWGFFRFWLGVAPANQTKVIPRNEKFMNFAHFCEFWCFSLGEQRRFTLNFCSGMPPGKVHELNFLWPFILPGQSWFVQVMVVSKGGFLWGGDSSRIGVGARTGCNNLNFAFFARDFLIESYINSEICTGIWRKINYCNRCAHHPNSWDFPPWQKPPFGDPCKSCFVFGRSWIDSAALIHSVISNWHQMSIKSFCP